MLDYILRDNCIMQDYKLILPNPLLDYITEEKLLFGDNVSVRGVKSQSKMAENKKATER